MRRAVFGAFGARREVDVGVTQHMGRGKFASARLGGSPMEHRKQMLGSSTIQRRSSCGDQSVLEH